MPKLIKIVPSSNKGKKYDAFLKKKKYLLELLDIVITRNIKTKNERNLI